MNVLLAIADDRAIRESLRAALPETDLLLFERTVEGALRRLISIEADAMILDDAPALGVRALERLAEAAPNTPVVALSSHGDSESQATLRLAGARVCVAKPFSCQKLAAAVADVMRPAAPSRKVSAQTANGGPPSGGLALPQHQTALRWLGRASGHIKDSIRLSQSLVDATTDIFDAVRSAVLLDTNGRVRIAASQGIPESVSRSVQLGFASGLMRWFEERACLIDSRLNPEAADAVKELQVLGVRLGVPLLCGGHVAGAILVGDKASGLEYTAEERELLIAVARSASIAFENAALYKNVSHQEQRLDGVLANIAAGVVTVRSNKTIGLLNSAGERILQLRAADVVGRSVQKLGSSFADVVLRALAEHKPYLRQEIHDPAINATLGLSATPLGDDGVAVVFSKLPEQETRSEDIAYSPFWEYLASRVAQEIKNPMVAINTFAQLLPRKYESQEFRESFGDVVQKEVERINHVVDTLFEFARRPRLVIQRASLNETVASVLQSFQDELGKHSIELETQWDSEQPDADLDPVYFAQALHNVVQNSIEAMPAGGRINVTTKQERGACQVIVADSGPGIRPQDESLLFLPFFSTKEQGMGLGLTVADRIMKQHAGDIRLLKSNNGGSAFELRLPKTKVIGQ